MSLYTIEHVFRRKVLTHYLASHPTKAQAARALGVHIRYFRRLLRRFGLTCVFLSTLFFLLAGCVAMSQDLAKDGQTIRCRNFGFGAFGVPFALVAQGSCIKEAENLGYAKVDTP